MGVQLFILVCQIGTLQKRAKGLRQIVQKMNKHPSIKTSMRIFDHTIKPIILNGSEIWGVFNPASFKFLTKSL